MNDDSAGMLTEGRFDSDVILSHTLEYTHTYNELPLNCWRWEGIAKPGGRVIQHREKPHLFCRQSLLTKGHDNF